MEAPERNKPLLLCQKCFAVIPDGAEYCAECGAPVVDDLGEGSDTAVYPELARANLLRMRGEYKMAEDICLAILRKHPNSATANTLLGDIHAEKGDLKQAGEWYEMALDITPDSEPDRRKLEEIRKRIKEHEAAATAQKLGLPESKPTVGIWVAGMAVFIILVATVAFLLGERSDGNARAEKDVTVPISIPQENGREAPSTPEKAEPSAPAPELVDVVKEAAGPEGPRVIGATRIPENMGVLLTFTYTGTEDPRATAAKIGPPVLGKVADAPQITFIALKEGRPGYIGTFLREKLPPTGEAADPNLVLSDEWPPPPEAAPPSGAEPPSTTGG